MEDFTHFNESGRARMVDVSDKAATARCAVAFGRVLVNRNTFDLIRSGGLKKGDVLTTAQIGGIMGAKRTSEIIPMCHPLMLTGINLHFTVDDQGSRILITAEVKTRGRTGVEMEALSAVSAAALTIYDMCKAVDRGMHITDIRVTEKDGGKSGHFTQL